MKTLPILLAALLAAPLVTARGQDARPAAPTVAVGTYDSRAVLVAYVRSKEHLEYQLGVQTDLNNALRRAEAAGDDALAREIRALGPAMQRRVHEQGFGTAPIDGVLARLEDRLPRIAQEAGVDLIVCRWDVAWRAPGARTVDVTERLAAEFEPDEATWKAIRELVRTDPVPAERLTER